MVLRRRACLLVEKFWSRRSVSSLQPQLHLRVIRLTSGMRILRNPVFARVFGSNSHLFLVFFLVLTDLEIDLCNR